MKIKPPFILFGFGILVLVIIWQYWYIVLPVGSLVLFLRAVFIYYLHLYGCVRCNAIGFLPGEDALLHLHFHADEACYMCAGKGIPPKDRQRWHHIAKNAIQKLQKLAVQEELLLQQVEQFRNSMKFSASTNENIVFAHNNILSKKYKQLAAIESETAAYEAVRNQAYTNAYQIHLIQRLDQERVQVETWEDQSTDNLTNSLYTVKDAAFLQKSDFIPLLQEQNQDYLPLISEPMRHDIDEAVRELQVLIKSSSKN